MSDPKKPAKPPEHVEVYFNLDGSYLYKLSGEYVSLKLGDVRRHMRALGLSEMNFFDGQRECDWPMFNAQINRRVNYAGSLGGHRVGSFTDGSNRRFLVTDEAKGIWDTLPKAKQPEFFHAFILELLGEDQAYRFCLWLACALRALRDKTFAPAQVSIFAGVPACGKSLLQYFITEILGGRAGNPMRYLMKETAFNDDLAQTEHWMVEEPQWSTDIRTRLAVGEALKELFYSRDFSIHAKGKRAVPLPLFRRGTISLNSEPEVMQKIPPFNGSIEDKVNLFSCRMATECLKQFDDAKTGIQDRQKLWSTFMAEVPTIRAWLLSKAFVVPKELRDQRAGVCSYHDPELKAQLSSFSPEVQLLEMCDLLLFTPQAIHSRDKGGDKDPVHWDGKAIDLEQELRQSKFAFRADQLLKGSGRAGTYLSRLEKQHPERVSRRKVNGHFFWTIKPPTVEKAES